MTIRAVLFDLDGTLLDTAPDFITALNLLLQQEHKKPLPGELIRQTVSNGASALVQLGFDITPEHTDFERLRQDLLKYYSKHLADQTKPFEGINDLLAYIHQSGMAWGIVTNKPELYTTPLLKQMQFACAPLSVVCPDHVTHRKPHPEPLLLACKQIGCAPAEAIYLGDHRRDIESAHHAGMPTIACAYGYIENDDAVDSWGANHVIHHPRETIAIVEHDYC